MTRTALLVLAAVAALAGLAGGASAQPLPASYYGGGLEAGEVVTASIGDAECGSDTVDDDGGWAISVKAGDCGGAAVAGATVAFAIDGAPAEQTAAWGLGWRPDDISRGIALTLAPRPSASFGGGGIGTGVVVAASIGGAACGGAAAGADGRWSIVVREGDCGGGAEAGAVVSFTLGGSEARPKAAWEAGGDTEVALTADWMTLGLEGARAAYVQDTDGVIAVYIPGAPDFVNAAFVRRWIVDSGGSALTLGIGGARALYVQGADGVIAVYIPGAPDFVNAAFVRRWIVESSR